MKVAETMRRKLEAGLTPRLLQIVDESAAHIGHAGHRPEGETHFAISIVSDRFDGKSRIERQRLVHGLLAEELSTRVHALSLRTWTAGEYEAGSAN